jgi:hypothetical protein
LLLVFVALYAALVLENSIEEDKANEEYILSLKNIYIETQKNKYFSKRFDRGIDETQEYLNSVYSTFYTDAEQLIKNAGPIFNFDYLEYEQNHFSALDIVKFKNKSLLATIIDLQETYKSTKKYWDEYGADFLFIAENYVYHAYYSRFPENSIENFGYRVQKLTSIKSELTISLDLVKIYSDNLLKKIDKELSESFNTNINHLISNKDMHLLAMHGREGGYYTESYRYFDMLIKRLENNLSDKKDSTLLAGAYQGIAYTIRYNYIDRNRVDLESLWTYKVPLISNEEQFNDISLSESVNYNKKSLNLFSNIKDKDIPNLGVSNYLVMTDTYFMLENADSAYYNLEKAVDAYIENELIDDEGGWLDGLDTFIEDYSPSWPGSVFNLLDDRYINIVSKYQKLIKK